MIKIVVTIFSVGQVINLSFKAQVKSELEFELNIIRNLLFPLNAVKKKKNSLCLHSQPDLKSAMSPAVLQFLIIQ